MQAKGHGGFRSIVIVEGEGSNITVFIPKQVVSYTWVVVPTTVEDKYIFVLEATFETNVPIPGNDKVIEMKYKVEYSSYHCGAITDN